MIEFTVFYLIFVFCFIFPPSAFVSAGITISNLFDSWLGSEDLQFVQYHLIRTLTTVVIHSLLPLGFFGGLLLVEGFDQLLLLVQTPFGLGLLCLSSLLPVIAAVKVFFWWKQNWCSHPLVVSLTTYATNGRHWNDVASEINAEFRRIDKVTVRTNPVSKTVITSSWIIKVEPYAIRVAHQNHVTVQLENAEEHDYTPDSQTTQYLWVKVEHLQTKQSLFTIRLNAMDYADMQNRLQTGISNVRGLLINQDIHARFSKVFIEEVNLNPVFQTQEEMDSCLGCGVNNANIRLVRRSCPLELLMVVLRVSAVQCGAYIALANGSLPDRMRSIPKRGFLLAVHAQPVAVLFAFWMLVWSKTYKTFNDNFWSHVGIQLSVLILLFLDEVLAFDSGKAHSLN